MAVSGVMYGQAISKAFNKEIDWDSDDIKVALVASGYAPNQDTHAYYSDLTNELPTANGYTSGGVALAGKTNTYTGATNKVMLDANDASWAGTSITARYAVVYDNTPATAATKPLIGYVDFGADVTTVAGTFTIQWDAAGIFEITVN